MREEEKRQMKELCVDSDEEICGADPENLVKPVVEVAYRRAAEELDIEISPEELGEV